MHKKVRLLVGIIFFCSGIVLGIFSALRGINHMRVIADYDSVTGTIVDIDISYSTSIDMETPQSRRVYVYVEYQAGGRVITGRLSGSNRRMQVGQQIPLLVSRKDPNNFVRSGIAGRLDVIAPLVATAGVGGIGTIFLISEIHKRLWHQWLLKYGTPVWATVSGTEANMKIKVNGRPATVLVATYKGERFVSEPINNDEYMSLGERVKVLMHPAKASRYTFDFKNASHRTPIAE